MNEIYATEPAAIRSVIDLKYLLEKFGWYEGRFLARFPKGWSETVRHKIAEAAAGKLTVLQEKQMEALLTKAHLSSGAFCTITKEGMFRGRDTWIANALRAVGDGIFDKHRVLQDALGGPFKSYQEVDQDWFAPSREEYVSATAENYVRVAAPILDRSSEIALVDPYFDLRYDRRKRVLAALFARLSSNGAESPRIVRIYLAERKRGQLLPHDPKFSIAIEEARRACRGQPPKVKAYLMRDKEEGRPSDQHARYLVSSLAALKFDRGFEEFGAGVKVHIGLCDRGVHAEVKEQYLFGARPVNTDAPWEG